jgi:DNA processing protein
MSRRDAEAELAAIDRLGGRLVCWGEPLYPGALAAVEDAPPVLTVLGRPEMLPRLLLSPMVAVVGARNASANGRRIARELAQGLGEAGIAVISGMARGIDAAAHIGSLDTGSVAVVAGGVDVVYPEENRGRSAPSRRRAISRAATGSSRGWRAALSWSRRRQNRAR